MMAISELTPCRKVVFFGAHTDDEMCCAGTLHKLAKRGADVHVVTFSPAATREDRRGNSTSSLIVLPEWHEALDHIGVGKDSRQFINLTPSVDFHKFRQMICDYVFHYIETHKPDACFILSPDDENTAHAILGTECERVMRGRVPVTLRCQFPWNYSIGRSNVYISLSNEDMTIKRQVINSYHSQLWRYQYEDMFASYCRADGLSVKVDYAEKFELIRGVYA